jgi:phage terminase small subunit
MSKKTVAKDISPERIELFCSEYSNHFNAKKAAQAIGYAESGAAQYGSALIGRPDVQARIEALVQEKLKTINVTKDSVLFEIAHIAFSDLKNYLKWGTQEEERTTGKGKKKKTVKYVMNYVNLYDSDKIDGRSIQAIRETREGISIKLHDKTKALEILARYFKLVAGEGQDADSVFMRMVDMAWKMAEDDRKKAQANADSSPAATNKG